MYWSKYVSVITKMDILHETLHSMDQYFFNLYQKGPSIFWYLYICAIFYVQTKKSMGKILYTTYIKIFPGVSM